MEENFFDKKLSEQLDILKNEDFYSKSELEQIEYLRNKGFFKITIDQRMLFLEKIRVFNLDVNEDPPTIPLTLDKVDYLNKKPKKKIDRAIAYMIAKKVLKKLLKSKKLIIKDVRGLENLINLNDGAIITCNHFNPFDCFTVEEIFRLSGKRKTNKLYKVIREGNFTNFPGLYGYFFRNCDTLPLASSTTVMKEFMKAVETILKKKDYILIYPEQSLWFNYKKPKPLQSGAFKIAVKNKTPILPMFICFEDSDIVDENGMKVQEYTVTIEKPIYLDENLSEKENIEYLKNKNYEIWKNIYEEFYKEKLKYIEEDEAIYEEK